MSDFRILLIDDEPTQIKSIQSFLNRRKFITATASSGKEGLLEMEKNHYDLVITDFRMPDISGLEVVKKVKEYNPDIQVIVITAYGQIEDAVAVMKAGAFEYLSKPVDLNELEIVISRARERRNIIRENRLLKEQLQEKSKIDGIITQNGEMEKVLSTVSRVAPTKATVLIRGESGTGKELIARAIHVASDRKEKPIITVNCAALSDNLLESELFGHEKGAFTGAAQQRIGRFELADEGTLFIDEVGDIPPATQVKLLRALQFGEIERVGGNQTLKVDVRVITATNKNLEELIEKNEFREDLFYRINVVGIFIPPLRSRKVDIPILANHFVEKYATQNGKEITAISRQAMDSLMEYHFPGNIRELENMIESAVVLSRGNILERDDFPSMLNQSAGNAQLDYRDFSEDYTSKVLAFEKAMLELALEKTQGNQSRAASVLGLSERHLRSRMQKIGIINKYKNRSET